MFFDGDGLFNRKVRKGLRKGRKGFFVFVFLAKTQRFFVCFWATYVTDGTD
jgi:hypothetical protein